MSNGSADALVNWNDFTRRFGREIGGVWGLDRGYCMMIGGSPDIVRYLDPIFAALAPGRGEVLRTPGRD